MQRVRRSAYARAGLLGNPSDLYGGRVLAVALANFRASVAIEPAVDFAIVPGADDRLRFASAREAIAELDAYGCDDGVRLVRAALRRTAALRGGLAELDARDPRLSFHISYETDVPRQVGLSGSSAIVTAALRALGDWFGNPLPPDGLARAALACESEELGIAAGPQDRVVQAHEGLLYMDFADASSTRVRRLDPALLPPLFVAWSPRAGQPSQRRHGDVRQRWLRGDPAVRKAIEDIAALADEGVRCLEQSDGAGFRALLDRNFELRASVYPTDPVDRALVEIARGAGGVAKLCGSGGAVVAALRDPADWPRLRAAYAGAGYAAEPVRAAEPAA